MLLKQALPERKPMNRSSQPIGATLKEPVCVKDAENCFGRTFGFEHAVLVNRASDGFLNILLALDCPPGSEVVLPVSICQTMVNATFLANYVPVLVDCDATLSLDFEALKRSLTNKTRVIVFHHPHGLAINPSAIAELASQRSLFLVEDCAQSLGARYEKRPVGNTGDAALFSFGGGKPLGLGYGGMVTAKSKIFADYLRLHVRCGLRGYPDDLVLGWPSLLQEEACVALTKAISAYPALLKQRQAAIENVLTAQISDSSSKQNPHTKATCYEHVYQRLIITTHPNILQQVLTTLGLEEMAAFIQSPLPTPAFKAPFLQRWYQRLGRPDLWDPLGRLFDQYMHTYPHYHFVKTLDLYRCKRLPQLQKVLAGLANFQSSLSA